MLGFCLMLQSVATTPDCETTITGHADSNLASSYSCGHVPTATEILLVSDGDTLNMVQDLHIKDLQLGTNSTILTNGFTIFYGL